MLKKLELLTKRLQGIMLLAEECQDIVRDLEDQPRNFEHTLTRVAILQVKIETIRQSIYAAEEVRITLSKFATEGADPVPLGLTSGETNGSEAEPDAVA